MLVSKITQMGKGAHGESSSHNQDRIEQKLYGKAALPVIRFLTDGRLFDLSLPPFIYL